MERTNDHPIRKVEASKGLGEALGGKRTVGPRVLQLNDETQGRGREMLEHVRQDRNGLGGMTFPRRALEMGGGIQRLKRGHGQAANEARAIGGAIHGQIVHEDQLIIGAELHIKFEDIDPRRSGSKQRRQRVSRGMQESAPVGNDQRAILGTPAPGTGLDRLRRPQSLQAPGEAREHQKQQPTPPTAGAKGGGGLKAHWKLAMASKGFLVRA
jgi:hypothetical protein